MTIKIKIISGFSALIVLMAALAALSYFSLRGASSGFEDYRRLSHFSTLCGDIASLMNAADGQIYLYNASDDAAAAQEAHAMLESMDKLFLEARDYADRAQWLENLRRAAEENIKLNAGLIEQEKNLHQVRAQYLEVVRPNAASMGRNFVLMQGLAASIHNERAAVKIAEGMEALAEARAHLNNLAISRKEAAAAASLESLRLIKRLLDDLEPMLQSQDGREYFALLRASYAALDSSLEEMNAACAALRTSLGQVARSSADLSAILNALDHESSEAMSVRGDSVLQANSSAQNITLWLSAGGIAIGALLACLITLGLIRLLAELSRFATSIAGGNLEFTIQSREKGEIGHMIRDMQRIPAVLKDILQEYHRMRDNIEQGALDAQGGPERFPGVFAALISSGNGIMERFRLLIDQIPTPVLLLNRELKTVYMNSGGRAVLGESYKGRGNAELLAREDEGTPACALARAAATQQAAGAETLAHPRGRVMDINYTVVPLLDADGKTASFLQVITDLTEIKTAQRTILRAAGQAADIARRVAEASERLSARVEEAAQGAGEQRSRAENTAQAMNEMSATVLDVARNAAQASEQSELARTKAKDGAELVREVVQSIRLVNRTGETLQDKMRALGLQAEGIGGVMNVISDIADQTNLLALNAAIEAARAGEAGRGFAVVADEVRKLAEKTMDATQEVGRSIEAIQEATRDSVKEAAGSAEIIARTTSVADASGTALAEIVSLSSDNSGVVASIASAAEEQSAAAEEINKAVSSISRIAADSSEGMAQAAAAVQELSAMAQELNKLMEELGQPKDTTHSISGSK